VRCQNLGREWVLGEMECAARIKVKYRFWGRVTALLKLKQTTGSRFLGVRRQNQGMERVPGERKCAARIKVK